MSSSEENSFAILDSALQAERARRAVLSLQGQAMVKRAAFWKQYDVEWPVNFSGSFPTALSPIQLLDDESALFTAEVVRRWPTRNAAERYVVRDEEGNAWMLRSEPATSAPFEKIVEIDYTVSGWYPDGDPNHRTEIILSDGWFFVPSRERSASDLRTRRSISDKQRAEYAQYLAEAILADEHLKMRETVRRAGEGAAEQGR